MAREAIISGGKALEIAKKKKIRSVSAVLSEKQGSVQSRKTKQLLWIESLINQELEEREHVRTLDRSMGKILFIDGNIFIKEKSG